MVRWWTWISFPSPVSLCVCPELQLWVSVGVYRQNKEPLRQMGREGGGGGRGAVILPGVSLPKLQLQSVVDLILSVGVSDVEHVLPWRKKEGKPVYITKLNISTGWDVWSSSTR